MTAETDAIAVAISSSSKTVTVFHGGSAIFAIEKPPTHKASDES